MNPQIANITKEDLTRCIRAGMRTPAIAKELGLVGDPAYTRQLVYVAIRRHFGGDKGLKEVRGLLEVTGDESYQAEYSRPQKPRITKEQLEAAFGDGLNYPAMADRFHESREHVRYCILKIHWPGMSFEEVSKLLNAPKVDRLKLDAENLLWVRGGCEQIKPQFEACIRAGMRSADIQKRLGISAGTVQVWSDKLWGKPPRALYREWLEDTLARLQR
jgi:hypothetical protein